MCVLVHIHILITHSRTWINRHVDNYRALLNGPLSPLQEHNADFNIDAEYLRPCVRCQFYPWFSCCVRCSDVVTVIVGAVSKHPPPLLPLFVRPFRLMCFITFLLDIFTLLQFKSHVKRVLTFVEGMWNAGPLPVLGARTPILQMTWPRTKPEENYLSTNRNPQLRVPNGCRQDPYFMCNNTAHSQLDFQYSSNMTWTFLHAVTPPSSSPPPSPHNFCWILIFFPFHLHAARCGTVAVQCFLFIILVTKFTFSLSFVLRLNYGLIKATKTVFQIATAHHITPNFRPVWRWVPMMLMRWCEDEAREILTKKMVGIVLRMQSNRIVTAAIFCD